MSTPSVVTEQVVRNHLQAFLEGKGIDAISSDYDDRALLYREDQIYRGKPQIRRVFESFMASLPHRATDRFVLRSLHVDGTTAFITWSVGEDIPLGTDTFIVKNGKSRRNPMRRTWHPPLRRSRADRAPCCTQPDPTPHLVFSHQKRRFGRHSCQRKRTSMQWSAGRRCCALDETLRRIRIAGGSAKSCGGGIKPALQSSSILFAHVDQPPYEDEPHGTDPAV